MKAWMLVAKEHPQVKFYAYTKSLTMWYHLQDDISSNFYLMHPMEVMKIT